MNGILPPDYGAHRIENLRASDPELWSRKIPGALMQYVWAWEMVEGAVSATDGPQTLRVLVIGGYEDPIVPLLKQEDFAEVTVIDPNLGTPPFEEWVNGQEWVIGKIPSFDIILSLSVLEHVPDGPRFLRRIARLLRPGGAAILTCDFKEGGNTATRKTRPSTAFIPPTRLPG